MGGTVTKLTLLSFCMMVLSSLVIAWEDIYFLLSSLWINQPISQENHQFVFSGYVWMIMNCFCSSAYVLGTQKRIKSGHFTDFDAMFYNDLLGIPFLIICTLIIDDWSKENISRNTYGKRIEPFVAILLSGIFSSGIAYTSLWCIRVTSSTTYSSNWRKRKFFSGLNNLHHLVQEKALLVLLSLHKICWVSVETFVHEISDFF
ncbi:hypothetical protein PMAC_001908 [Pneumocystis sp. 'macacae']|nr:hypothetical protein PMAC_001908 [Pneumocystis sp. 'macacae']